MTKRQRIDAILERNHTADPGFLSRFEDTDLDEYLEHLCRLDTPRLIGDATRYEKYFAQPLPPETPPSSDQASSPCLPEEQEDVDESIWHVGDDPEEIDEVIRSRVDRFADQLLDRLAEEGVLPNGETDDDGGEFLDLQENYDEELTLQDDEEDEDLQPISRSFRNERKSDSWLF